MGAAVRGHGHRCRGAQYPCLSAVVHSRQADHRDRAEVGDRLLAQFDVDGAALRDGAVLERQPVLTQPGWIGGQCRARRRQRQPYVGPVLAGALPDHRVGLQREAVPVGYGTVGRTPQRARGEMAQTQSGRPCGPGVDGQFDVAGQFGGLRLGEADGLFGLGVFGGEGGQPGFHGAQSLAVGVALLVHTVQFAAPAGPVGLAGAGALADVPQQISGETAEQVEAGAQPVALPAQGEQLLFERVRAVAQGGIVGGGPGPARRPAADDPHVEDGHRVFGGQLGVQRTVDGQRTDGPETQPLDSGLEVEHATALDVGAVLQAGDGGDGEGDRLRCRGHGVCQLLRLPPARLLADGMRIS